MIHDVYPGHPQSLSSGELIWVDENNCVTGYGEKLYTHQISQLHRAFSIFIYNKETKKYLIQQRALDKYHSGGKWSNACCSHPYRNESWGQALSRCLSEELGLRTDEQIMPLLYVLSSDEQPPAGTGLSMFYCGRFHYESCYGSLSEHEMDHVFLYIPNEDVLTELAPNPLEISDVCWISEQELKHWLEEKPEDFSSWFARAYALVPRNC